MHATIVLSQSIHRVLQYHTLKAREGSAELIGGENFIKEPLELSRDQLLYHYNRLIALDNQGYKPVLHVLMTFSRRDELSNAAMLRVAQDYMEPMGFAGQPWLAYRHRDTLHPHVHLVSTTRRADGSRIKLTTDVLRYSRELTHGLEQRHGLDQSDEVATLRAQYNYLQEVEYGKVSLYPAIKLVLETILPTYKYTNLEELNAVLGLFNVRASRGREGSLIHEHRGLIYYPLLADGREGPAYIKASAFSAQATLPRLEERFAENLSLREEHRRRLTSTIDYALAGSTLSFDAFRAEMGRQQVSVVGLSPVWYVDHRGQTVFDGADLGTNYSGTMLLSRCLPDEVYQARQEFAAQSERQGHRMRHSL